MAKIMIVDDTKLMRQGLNDILSGNGFDDIFEVKDGETALEEYKKQKPDIILLDIVMPGISGVDVLRKIKQKNPDQKIIMVTTIGDQETVEECNKLGADGYLHKPFEYYAVTELIKELMNNISIGSLTNR